METCDICGKDSVKVWFESEEVWGRVERHRMEECLNPNCGEESEDDE